VSLPGSSPALAAAPDIPLARPRRHWPWMRSAGVRFALVYALMLALTAGALAMLLWWSTAGVLDRQTESAIRADAQGLSERWTEGGLPALILTIDDRLAQNTDGDAIYLLVNAKRQRLVGNLPRWPDGLNEPGVSYGLDIVRGGHPVRAMVQRFDLPGDVSLLVGRDARMRLQLRSLLADAMVWALLAVVLMAAAGAAVMRSLFLHTIANISATAAAISSGDLTRRVNRSGRGDEFDQLAETINDMLDRIARLMDGVRSVSNAIAHDLRTPITRARARLEDAAQHARTEEELRAAIERGTAELDDIVAIFRALLRIAEVESGARRSAFARFDLIAMLHDMAEMYAAVAEEEGKRLRTVFDEPVTINGDRTMVQQAVANLLGNAIKFSPDGGEITLHVSGGDRVEIAVLDEGPGIPESERGRAADRFYRGETARNTPGSGLGLALVQAVARLHGGDLLLMDAWHGAIPPGLRAVLVLMAESGGGAAPNG
jgi:signal transduction histidine kinase